MPSLSWETCRWSDLVTMCDSGTETLSLTSQVECSILAVLWTGDRVKESERTQHGNNRKRAKQGGRKESKAEQERLGGCPLRSLSPSSPFGFYPFCSKLGPILPKQKNVCMLFPFWVFRVFGIASHLSQCAAGGEGTERWQFCQAGTVCNDPSCYARWSPDRQGRESHSNSNKQRRGLSRYQCNEELQLPHLQRGGVGRVPGEGGKEQERKN